LMIYERRVWIPFSVGVTLIVDNPARIKLIVGWAFGVTFALGTVVRIWRRFTR
jgi:hypothetical protein